MKKEMPKKWFYKHLMSSEFDGSLLVKGRYYKDDKVAEIHDGAVVTIGDLEMHSTYSVLRDLDVRKITAPSAIANEVAIVDLVNVSEGKIGDNTYREGKKTIGLTVEAGYAIRVRKFTKGDSFFLASGNFIGTPAVGKYAVPTVNDTLWTVVDAPVEEATAIKIELGLDLIEGTAVTETKYLCTVAQVAGDKTKGATGQKGDKGDQGEQGPKGDKGADGVTPQFKKTDTAIQVSTDNGETFTNLVLLSEIKGDKGQQGDKGPTGDNGITPQFKKTATAIQISVDNGKTFTDLVLLSELKGDKGATGDKGVSVTAISLTKDANGAITGGTATLSDNTSVAITVTTVTA